MRTRMVGVALLLLALTAVDGLSEDTCVVLVGKALNARSSRSVKDILESKVGGCTVQVLDYMQDLPKADLSSVKFMYFPGGKYYSIKPSAEAVANVRKAVARGMGYFGTCGGTLIAVETTGASSSRNQLGLFPGNQPFGGGTEFRDYNFDITHPVVAHSSVAERITPIFRVHFNGGGRDFQPAVAGLVHWVVATSPMYNNKPAFTATMFGRGRVFLTTAHPERSYYPQSHPVVILAAEWGLGRTNPTDDQLPKIQADIPVAGRPGEPLRFSGAGSDDPDGYPIGFIWDFGDGSEPAYRPEHTHKYARSGDYAVTLTVTDGKNDATYAGKIVIAGAPWGPSDVREH